MLALFSVIILIFFFVFSCIECCGVVEAVILNHFCGIFLMRKRSCSVLVSFPFTQK